MRCLTFISADSSIFVEIRNQDDLYIYYRKKHDDDDDDDDDGDDDEHMNNDVMIT